MPVVDELVTLIRFKKVGTLPTKETDKFKRRTDLARAAVVKFRKAASTAFAAVRKAAKFAAVGFVLATTAVVGLISSTTKAGDEVGKTAKKIGAGVEELQRLRFAADRSGASSKVLTTSLRQQALFMEQAARGGAVEFRSGLESIGLALSDVQGLGAEERFGLMADRIKGIADPAKRTAVAMQLFGSRAGPELVPLLLEGSAGIKALGDEAGELGLIMSDQFVADSEAFQDTLTNLKGVLSGLANELISTLLPGVNKGIKGFIEWAKANRGLINERLKAFVKSLGKALSTLAEVASVVGKAIGFVVDNMNVLLPLIGGAVALKAISGIAGALSSVGVAATGALGPIGLMITAMSTALALGQAFSGYTDSLHRDAQDAETNKDGTQVTDRRGGAERFFSKRTKKTIQDREAELAGAKGVRARELARLRLEDARDLNRRSFEEYDKINAAEAENKGAGAAFGNFGSALFGAVKSGKLAKGFAKAKGAGTPIARGGRGGGGGGGGKVSKTPTAAPTLQMVTNRFEISQSNTVPVTVNGVPGTTARDVASEINKRIGEVLSTQVLTAIEASQTRVVR